MGTGISSLGVECKSSGSTVGFTQLTVSLSTGFNNTTRALSGEEKAQRPYENYSEDEQHKLNNGFSDVFFLLYLRDQFGGCEIDEAPCSKSDEQTNKVFHGT